MELVEVKKDEVFCDSSLVARKFGYKHNHVVRSINILERNLEKLRGTERSPKTIKEPRVYRGAKYEAYLMNREFFSLLVMRFKGDKALEWQLKFNSAFYMMEKRLMQLEVNLSDKAWIGTREKGKISRREETDVIKEFVEYATKQGSTKAGFYYKHITNATYKALGLMCQKKPKLRDAMNIYEVSELLLAERKAKDSITKYMELGRNYKDVYECVKDDLIEFSGALKMN